MVLRLDTHGWAGQRPQKGQNSNRSESCAFVSGNPLIWLFA